MTQNWVRFFFHFNGMHKKRRILASRIPDNTYKSLAGRFSKQKVKCCSLIFAQTTITAAATGAVTVAAAGAAAAATTTAVAAATAAAASISLPLSPVLSFFSCNGILSHD